MATTDVYARVSPDHKLRILSALQRQGEIVAMTGDGVNDAPALKQANIGVAMEIQGTEVAREAADMVLLDDNFATIVAAVEEGRVICDNIRKFLKYLLATNAGEPWVMLLGPLLGMPLPLLPLQLRWINLLTDGLPALALSVERAERDRDGSTAASLVGESAWRRHAVARSLGWPADWWRRAWTRLVELAERQPSLAEHVVHRPCPAADRPCSGYSGRARWLRRSWVCA